jgi:hypothetical protein
MEKNAGTARRRSTSSRRQDTKVAVVTRRLRAKRGASIDELAMHTGWQKHSVRGLLSGTLKKKMGLIVTSQKVTGRGRVYRIVDDPSGA